MVLILVLVFMILVYLVKKSSNSEVIRENCKTPNDKANVVNARKVYNNTNTSKVLLIASIAALIFVILLKFTSLEYVIRDYISSDFVEEKEFSYLIFVAPAYIFVSRLIINEVKLGDFLYKFFKVKEPELEENLIKTILFKKPAQKPSETTVSNPETPPTHPEEVKKEETELPKENPEEAKEEPKPEVKEEEKKETPNEESLELPEEKK